MPPSKPERKADAPQPSGCTNLQLRRLTRQVTQRYDAQMAAAGLKTTQYSLLSAVLQMGPARPADLAAQLNMDASTLTRNLKPLISAGWVDLTAGADARSRAVSITELGRSKRAEAQRHWKAAQLSLNNTLGLDRVAALHDLIHQSLALLAGDEAPAHED
jgi:DNA-binding MarR family transcriptional regulator